MGLNGNRFFHYFAVFDILSTAEFKRLDRFSIFSNSELRIFSVFSTAEFSVFSTAEFNKNDNYCAKFNRIHHFHLQIIRNYGKYK